MGNPATATPASPRSNDAARRSAQLDRVVAQLRALERSRDGAGARGGELSETARAWAREATLTRRRLTGSPRPPLTATPNGGLR